MSVDVTLWSSEAWSSAADVQLLAEARSGSAEAYGELWRRHLPAAYAVASRHRGRSSAEDIVAEASARVLSLIQDGKGPEEHFRSYFLSTVRTVAVDNARRDLRVVPAESDDLEALTDPVLEDFPGDGIDADLVREAFAGLSERDRRVLWHTTVEGEAPRTLAPVLGMTANAVSASAMRARDALRAHYLDAHAARRARSADSDECRWTIDHLGAHVRGRLPKRQAERVRRHLDQCPHAATVAAELTDINAGFPALLVPLILLGGISTPGFVSAGALAGLSAGAVSAGSAAPAGASAVRPDGSPAASSSGGASSGSQVVIAGQQMAAAASSVAAAIVIAAGVVGASPGGLHGPAVAAPAGRPTPTASSPAGLTGSAGGGAGRSTMAGTTTAGSPSGQTTAPPIATGAGAGSSASSAGAAGGLAGAGAGAGSAGAGAGSAVGGAAAPGGALAGGGAGVGGTAVPGAFHPGTSPTSPQPLSTSPAAPGGSTGTPSSSPASGPATSSASATPSSTSSTSAAPSSSSTTTTPPAQHPEVLGLVSLDGEAWVRIPTGSVGVKVTLVNFSGNGTLTPTNQAWRCSGGGSSKLTCVVTSNGRFTLQQGGLVTAQPIVVRFASIPGAAVIIPVG